MDKLPRHLGADSRIHGVKLRDLPVTTNGQPWPHAEVLSMDTETGLGLVAVRPGGPLLKVAGLRLVRADRVEARPE